MKISIILPTYNNERTIEECLNSIRNQNLNKREYEILFIDGGSTDSTIEIGKKYHVKFIKNKKRNEEAARILGISKARGEIIAFIDADNVLPERNWLRRMLLPFEDKQIIFADTLYYSYRKKDRVGVRYQALIGGDDPLATYLGLYSRWCYFKQNWTDFPYYEERGKNYIKIRLKDKELVPAMGSNGFLIRKNILKKFVKGSFIHSDIIYELVNSGYNCFAKVDTGIIHNQPKFFPNKIRRIKRRLRGEINIKYNYGITFLKTLKVFFYIMAILPVLIDSFRGHIKKPDSAWFFHPLASIALVFIYGFYNIKNFFKEILEYCQKFKISKINIFDDYQKSKISEVFEV